MIRIIREISQLVAAANEIAASAEGDTPRWSLFLTNRSFIAQCIATIAAGMVLFGIALPGSPDMWAEGVLSIVFMVTQVWATGERVMGTTRVVWSREQATSAVEEADALTRALDEAQGDCDPQ